jgi:hypothetical protein
MNHGKSKVLNPDYSLEDNQVGLNRIEGLSLDFGGK